MVSTIIPFERIQKIARNPEKFQELIGESGFFSSVKIDNIEVYSDRITCDYSKRKGAWQWRIQFYPNEEGRTNIEAEMNWPIIIIGFVLTFAFMMFIRGVPGKFFMVSLLVFIPLFFVLKIVLKDQIPSDIKNRITERILDIENGEEIS